MADESESDLEKTESPSERRLEQAREQGNIPRSRELSSVLMLVSMAYLLYSLAPKLRDSLFAVMRTGLSFDHDTASTPNMMLERMGELIAPTAMTWMPLLFGVGALVAFAHILVGGWYFNPDVLIPKFERLNPLTGLGRLFSKHSIEELVKALIKTGWLSIIAGWLLWKYKTVALAFGLGRDFAPFYEASSWLGEMLIRLSAALLLIVFIEIPWVLYSYNKSLSMTKEELKEEAKESEGDPHIKARIRQLQRDSARKRMMSQVPKANVVVVNPTRYAVALHYEASMQAPQIVAKGMGTIAQRIREVANEHGISIITAPPVARALYYHGDLDKTIPIPLFNAVAEVLAYVYQLEEASLYHRSTPELPTDWSVPKELDPEHNAPVAPS